MEDLKMKNIEKEIIEQYERYNKNFTKEIREEEEKQSKGESNFLEWLLQRHLTSLMIKKWKNEEITTSEAIDKAIKREEKENEKAKENTLKKLEDIRSARRFYKNKNNC